MSSGLTQAPSSSEFFPPAFATYYSAFIIPAVTFLMISSTMGAVLVAMLMALLFFSSSSTVRKPMFIMNILAVLLGISGAVITTYAEIRTIETPANPLSPRVIIAIGALNALTPILVDSILLLRLHTVYGYQQTHRMKYVLIMAIPVLLKIGRLVNAAIYLNNYARNIHSLIGIVTGTGAASVLATSPLPSVRIEWFFQVFDDIYSSCIFLVQVHRQGLFHSTTSQSTSQRLKTLFWICTSTFVFPVALSIVQLSIYLASSNNYFLALYVEEVNFYFTIMGVVFATVWAEESRWEAARLSSDTKAPATKFPSMLRITIPQNNTQLSKESSQFTNGNGHEDYAFKPCHSVDSHLALEQSATMWSEKVLERSKKIGV